MNIYEASLVLQERGGWSEPRKGVGARVAGTETSKGPPLLLQLV